jgi:crotonobetainyl-CoA:carnitine CoA-transferase CaiB-like acyl-CoA transferase
MQWFKEISGYPGLERPARVPDLPLRFSRSQAGIETRPPTLGEHTDEVLEAIGIDATHRASLRQRGVIR